MRDDLIDLFTSDVHADDVQLVTGTVTDTSVWPPQILVPPSGFADDCPVLSGYAPSVGDFVHVLIAGGSRVCIGKAARGSGCELTRSANQSATGAATNAVSWDTAVEDVGNYWTSGTDITIPAGAGAVYAVHAVVIGAASWAADSNIDVLVGGTAYARMYNGRIAPRLMVSMVRPLDAGNVITVEVFNNGTTQNFTARVYVYAVA